MTVRGKVLLVGNDSKLLRLYSLALRLRGGYEVHYTTFEDVESPTDQVDGLLAVVFDFDVVDERVEATARRVLDKVRGPTVALVCSAEDARKCKLLGFDFVVQKPLPISSLVELVKPKRADGRLRESSERGSGKLRLLGV